MNELFGGRSGRGRWVARLAATAVVGAAITPLTGLAGATAAPSPHHQRFDAHQLSHQQLAALAATRAHVDTALKGATGNVDVMLQLAARPAAYVWKHYSVSGLRGRTATSRVDATRAQIRAVKSLQSSVESHFGAAATRAHTIYKVHNLYDGIAVHTTANRLGALSNIPGVVAIHKLVPKKVSNTVTVPLIGAPSVWDGAGSFSANTGSGVNIGIIDTGIDYTHADFGGEGTTGAYDAAKARSDVWPNGQHAAAPALVNNPATGFTGFDGSKVVGGYDFAGNNYDASGTVAGTSLSPTPDGDPLDCNSHGTHVAGTAAGLGVTTSNQTYTGSYTGINESNFHVGPGVAPGANLYALKVFGCEGSTDLVAEALDWAADPNGDANMADHLDVVNMSLGSDFGSPEDPDSVASNAAVDLGINVAAAAGNGGDLFDIGGSPGNATKVIGVAASMDSTDILDGISVAADPNGTLAGNQYPASMGALYDWSQGGVIAPITWSPASDLEGCADYPANYFAGHIAVIEWDPTGCTNGSIGRSAKATAAGAVGVLFVYESTAGDIGISINGSPDVPSMITNKPTGDALQAELATLGANADTMTVNLDPALHNTQSFFNADRTDVVTDFSSRGIGMAGNLKPDVTAPGFTVFSAGMGSGTDGLSDSGTSMATPHITGVVALLKAQHPTWTPEQVKAAIMNTANPDVCNALRSSTVCPTGQTDAPRRVGAGRVQVDKADTTTSLAYNPDDAGAVSVSFGPVDAHPGASTVLTKHIRVRNLDSVAHTYTATYQGVDTNPGADITVDSGPTASVASGDTVDLTVTLTVTPANLVSRPDGTLTLDQVRFPGFPIERSFVSDVSGAVVVTPDSGNDVRVPVYAAPRAVSTMNAPGSIALNSSGVGSILLSGSNVLNAPAQDGDLATISTVDALELTGVSPEKPACGGGDPFCTPFPDDKAADLRYVGFASDAPTWTSAGLDPYSWNPAGNGSLPPAMLYVGVAGDGPWRSPQSLGYVVFMDITGDGYPDIEMYNASFTDTDSFVSVAWDLNNPDPNAGPLDIEFLNHIDAVTPAAPSTYYGALDTETLNSQVMTMPIALAAIKAAGYNTSKLSNVSFFVDSFSGYGFEDEVGDPFIGDTPMSVNALKPAVETSDMGATSECAIQGLPASPCISWLNQDKPGVSLTVKASATPGAEKPLGVLLLHHNNANADQAEVVDITKWPTATKLAVAKSPAPYGYANAATVTVTSGSGIPAGTVQVWQGSTKVGSAHTLNGSGVASFNLPTLSVGSHSLKAIYTPSAGDAANHFGSQGTKTVKVVKASTKTVLSASDGTPAAGQTIHLHAVVSVINGGRAPIAGTVTFYDGTTQIGKAVSVSAAAGKSATGNSASFKVVGKGRHTFWADFTPAKGTNILASTGSTSVRAH